MASSINSSWIKSEVNITKFCMCFLQFFRSFYVRGQWETAGNVIFHFLRILFAYASLSKKYLESATVFQSCWIKWQF